MRKGNLSSFVCSFLKGAYFLSYILSPYRESGTRVTCDPLINSLPSALDAAMRRCKPYILRRGTGYGRRDEPSWHRPDIMWHCCDEISASNTLDVRSAFSITPGTFDHLTTFRNFYAHRNPHTARQAINIARLYSIPTNLHPSQILLTPAYGRPQPLILDWLDDITTVVELLCE